MVKIITGKINSSKTTRITEHYLECKKGDGIISKKVMQDNKVFGYKASRLSDNLEFSFMIHEDFYNNDLYPEVDVFDNKFSSQIGPYKVFTKAMKKVNSIYKDLIRRKVAPLYFDEVGKLEIEKNGFYKMIKKALKNDVDIIFTAREDLVEEIVDIFNISNYEIISR